MAEVLIAGVTGDEHVPDRRELVEHLAAMWVSAATLAAPRRPG